MDENQVLNEVDEAVADVSTPPMTSEEFKEATAEILNKIRNNSMILGYRTACMTIMQLISPWHQPNCSHREYERIFKKVEEFCNKALNQAKKTDDETVQN